MIISFQRYQSKHSLIQYPSKFVSFNRCYQGPILKRKSGLRFHWNKKESTGDHYRVAWDLNYHITGIQRKDERTRGPSQYQDVVLPVWESHYKDKTVSRPSYLYNGNPIHGEMVFILRRGPAFCWNGTGFIDQCVWNVSVLRCQAARACYQDRLYWHSLRYIRSWISNNISLCSTRCYYSHMP